MNVRPNAWIAFEADATARPDDPYYVLPWGYSLLHLAGITVADVVLTPLG